MPPKKPVKAAPAKKPAAKAAAPGGSSVVNGNDTTIYIVPFSA